LIPARLELDAAVLFGILVLLSYFWETFSIRATSFNQRFAKLGVASDVWSFRKLWQKLRLMMTWN
jgi:hypothetical protein